MQSGCGMVAPAVRICEQPSFSAESNAAQPALGRVVRQANATNVEEARERLPSFEDVVDRLPPIRPKTIPL